LTVSPQIKAGKKEMVMDKIKLPVIYDPELFHIRDADGEFVGLMNVELEISDAALHRRGNQIADAINTAADLSRQVAVLIEALEHPRAITRIVYAKDQVWIDFYANSSRAILHYRERKGDWLHDNTVSSDWESPRKWKEFRSIAEAFAFLKTKSQSPSQVQTHTRR
jgi:S-methylmethionine-dependent homocysteine/selenocysteine methylase